MPARLHHTTVLDDRGSSSSAVAWATAVSNKRRFRARHSRGFFRRASALYHPAHCISRALLDHWGILARRFCRRLFRRRNGFCRRRNKTPRLIIVLPYFFDCSCVSKQKQTRRTIHKHALLNHTRFCFCFGCGPCALVDESAPLTLTAAAWRKRQRLQMCSPLDVIRGLPVDLAGQPFHALQFGQEPQ